MDMYNTVWLSDYESCKSEADSLNQSVISSLNHSRSTVNYNSISEATTPFGTPGSSRPITPSRFTPIQNAMNLSSEDDRVSTNSVGKKKLRRTLSLPDSEFATLNAHDLQDRFTRLQLEQENKDLKKLTSALQDALEKLEEQFIGHLERPESEQVYIDPSLPPTPRSPLLERHDNEFSYDDNDDDDHEEGKNSSPMTDEFKQLQHRRAGDKFDQGCCKTQ